MKAKWKQDGSEMKANKGQMRPAHLNGALEQLMLLYEPVDLSLRQRQAEVVLIAKELWNMSFSSLIKDLKLTTEQQQEFLAVKERRQAGEPLAYILGSQGFYDSVYLVSSDVLIPRSDSECLIDWLLDSFASSQRLRLLDIGTGSGALALSLAAKRPSWSITATDIDSRALRLARDNALRHRLAIRLIHTNLFPPSRSRYDVILSNPPYLTHNEKIQQPQLGYEPLVALVGGSDGLALIKRILKTAPQYLKRGGWLVLEHGWRQHNLVKRLARRLGYVRCSCLYDLGGQQRAIVAQHRKAL